MKNKKKGNFEEDYYNNGEKIDKSKDEQKNSDNIDEEEGEIQVEDTENDAPHDETIPLTYENTSRKEKKKDIKVKK